MCIHTCARVCVRVGYSCSPVATPTPNECIDVSFAADVYVYARAHVSYIDMCHSENKKKKADKSQGRCQTGKITTLQSGCSLSLSLSIALVFLSVVVVRLVFDIFF